VELCKSGNGCSFVVGGFKSSVDALAAKMHCGVVQPAELKLQAHDTASSAMDTPQQTRLPSLFLQI